jgi:hypothetical protein
VKEAKLNPLLNGRSLEFFWGMDMDGDMYVHQYAGERLCATCMPLQLPPSYFVALSIQYEMVPYACNQTRMRKANKRGSSLKSIYLVDFRPFIQVEKYLRFSNTKEFAKTAPGLYKTNPVRLVVELGTLVLPEDADPT